MLKQKTAVALNRLLATLYRSLPMYLTYAMPWTKDGDQRAVEVLRYIVADQKSACTRIAEYLQSHQAPVNPGDYPMGFTDLHDLALDYLVSRLIRYQKQDLATIEQCVQNLKDDSQAHALAEEALGAARAHLEALTELAAKVSQPSPTVVGESTHCRRTMFFDTHAHLDQEEFDSDRAEVIQRAQAASVSTIVTVGTTAQASAKCVELAGQASGVYAAVGLQPNYVAQAAPTDWDRIVELVEQPRVVAIGETGLDRYWDYSPFSTQQEFFDRHLRLSQERDLPFIVHTRESDADVLAMLREARVRGPLRGVMHSFTGSAETAAECLELGMWISFAGMVTFKKSDALRTVAAGIPANRILIETDSPYLSPHPLRGKRNEPANLVHTAACLAELRAVTIDEFARQTTANARELFRLNVADI